MLVRLAQELLNGIRAPKSEVQCKITHADAAQAN